MTKLYVNGTTELDILDNTVKIFKEILDKDSIANRSSNWTREIELPNTPANNEYFEDIYKLDTVTLKFRKGKRVKALITDGADTLLEGFMQLINTNTNSGETTYSVIFAGQLIDLMSSVEDISLTSLDLSEYNHIRDWDTIKNSWNFNIQKYGDTVNLREGYVYPDIMYNDNGFDKNKYYFDYYPATNIKTIVDKIFETVNIKYNSDFFDSNYFRSLYMPFSREKLEQDEEKVRDRTAIRSFNHDTAHPNQVVDGYWNGVTNVQQPRTPTHGGYWSEDLQLPYNLNRFNLTFFNDKETTIGPSNHEIQLTDNLNQIFQDKYTCQNQGEYDININIPIVPKYDVTLSQLFPTVLKFEEGQLEYRWIVYLKRENSNVTEILARNNEPVASNPLGLSYFAPSDNEYRNENQLPWYDTNTRLDIICSTTRFLNPGDKIFIQFHYKHTETKWNATQQGSPLYRAAIRCQLMSRRVLNNSYAKFEVKPSSNQGYGEEYINLADTLPDMSSKDFLLSIIQAFNLVIDLDEDSTAENPVFKIEPYHEFFKHGKIITDWKLDESSDMKQIYNKGIKKYELSYTDDDDFYNKHYYESLKPNRVYGDFNVFSTDEMADKTDELDIKFAPTISANVRSGDRIVPYLCDIEDEKFKPMKTKPRMLFYNGTLPCEGYNVMLAPKQPLETMYEYPYIGMWDDPYDPTNTLEFDHSKYSYYTPSNKLPMFTLFNKFYQNLRGKVAEEYRMVEAYFYLTSTQFAQFRFTDKILVDNQLYRVVLIDGFEYSEEETLTKVFLEKIVDYFYAPTDITKSKGYAGSGSNTGSVCPTDIKLHHYSWGRRYESKSGNITKACCIERGGNWDPVEKTCNLPFGNTDGGVIVSPSEPKLPTGPIAGTPDKPTIGIIDIDKTINRKPVVTNPGPDVVGGTLINSPDAGKISQNIENMKLGGTSVSVIDSGEDFSTPKNTPSSVYILDGSIDEVRNKGLRGDLFVSDGNKSKSV